MKKNTAKSLLLFVLCLFSTSAVFAFDFEKDGLYYNIISSEDKTVEVYINLDDSEISIPIGGQEDDGIAEAKPRKLATIPYSLEIPETVESDGKTYTVVAIRANGFANTELLKAITIPSTVKTIGDAAFSGCKNLMTVNNYSETPQALPSADVFKEIPFNATLFVQKSSIELYKSANVWKSFFSIQALPKVRLLGDINNDDKVDVADAVALVNCLVAEDVSQLDLDIYDVNKDDEIDADDVVAIITLYLKK